MKADEIEFLLAVARLRPGPTFPFSELAFATDVASTIGMHPNRALYLLEKWCRKDWWEYGVTLRSGWLTEKGLAKATEFTMAGEWE